MDRSCTGGPGSGVPLSSLRPGDTGEVLCVEEGAPLRQRLLDLGFVPGTRVEVLFASPLGDPVAYRVEGAVVALRRGVARWVSVRGAADAGR